ncbi:MAG: adenylosuccinate synthase [bacterium]
MTNVVVIGAQWGDEGKAKITDLLSEYADLIIRYQGGCNAGHTVVVDNKTYKFHLIPSGVLYDNKTCIIGPGTVINPPSLTEELDGLKEQGISTDKLYISTLAHITMPWHIDIDSNSEKSLGKNKIGTTNKGIGPTYTDKYNRLGIRAEDLLDVETLSEKLDVILPQKNEILEKIYGLKPYTKEEILLFCKKYAEILKPFICDTIPMVTNAVKTNKQILFEGAQGSMLDINYGTYPYVTSSSPVAGGATIGSGIGPTHINRVIGVSKAYTTRVGEGPFLTELEDEYGKKIQEIGHEFGTTTGRARRCGWIDCVALRYAAAVNGMTDLALTKIDIFNNFEELKICVAYRDTRDGKVYRDYPTNIYIHKYLEAVYETMPGWNSDICNITDYDKLPSTAKEYIKKVEEEVGVTVSIISVGANRDNTIILDNPLVK